MRYVASVVMSTIFLIIINLKNTSFLRYRSRSFFDQKLFHKIFIRQHSPQILRDIYAQVVQDISSEQNCMRGNCLNAWSLSLIKFYTVDLFLFFLKKIEIGLFAGFSFFVVDSFGNNDGVQALCGIWLILEKLYLKTALIVCFCIS